GIGRTAAATRRSTAAAATRCGSAAAATRCGSAAAATRRSTAAAATRCGSAAAATRRSAAPTRALTYAGIFRAAFARVTVLLIHALVTTLTREIADLAGGAVEGARARRDRTARPSEALLSACALLVGE